MLSSGLAIDALQRLLDSSGSEIVALRRSLAANLAIVTGQRLFRRENGSGRVPAYEWISSTRSTREAISAGDLDALRKLQDTEPECRSINAALDDLIASGQITEAAASPYR